MGGDTLHIAHMLWGGLGMVIGFGMLLLFADDVWKPIAALVDEQGFANVKVATAINGEFVPERMRTATSLRPGDRIEILTVRQGG